MNKILHLALCLGMLCNFAQAQQRVLVFTKTNGFTHPSIDAGVQMITDLGMTNGLWTTDQSEDASVFNSNNLSQYAVVIFCNTSGNNLLNANQRVAFEEFIANGGGFMGIHAATDTYRDGSWPFYNELVGGIVQTNPNHTANNFNATMTVVNAHPAVDFLGGSYNKDEEYYYWERNGGFLYSGNIDLLEVESTGDQSYDAPRPISWYKEYGGGRSFYTAMGHNSSDYTQDELFIRHIEEGIKYLLDGTLSLADLPERGFQPADRPFAKAIPNPITEQVEIFWEGDTRPNRFTVVNTLGQELVSVPLKSKQTSYQLDSRDWSPGLYFIRCRYAEEEVILKIVKR
ncbi:ThuA domain-containing protein [Croceiramulus getboli]|nr:ThuA domain-containing protein [Flavobacteriaceae bacterium YJPT1-3]